MSLKLQDLEQQQKNILFDLAALQQRQTKRQLSYKAKTVPNQFNTVIQFKPNSQDKKGFVLKKLQVQGKNNRVYKNGYNLNKREVINKQNIQTNNGSSILKSQKSERNEKIRSIKNQIGQKYQSEKIQINKNIIKQNLFQYQNKIYQDQQEDQLLFYDDSLDIKEIVKNQEAKLNLHKISLNQQQKENFNKIINNSKQTKRKRANSQMECTFKPAILKKSKELALKLQPSFSRLTTSRNRVITQQQPYKQHSQNSKKYSKQHIKSLSKPRIVNQTKTQQQKFPFKPILSKKSTRFHNDSSLDVISRNQLWQYQRQQKINKLREEQQRQKLQKEAKQMSSNHIQSASYKRQKQVHLSKFVQDGLVGYFERIQHAQNIKNRGKQAQQRICGNGISKKGISKQVKQVGQRQYQKAVKQLHDKILRLNL